MVQPARWPLRLLLVLLLKHALGLAPSPAPLLVEDGLSTSSNSSGGSGSSVPASFRPSIAVIVGVLTTMFSLTFLLLIYAKHCKRNPVGVFGPGGDEVPALMPQQLLFRTDTGIDPAVVEALPTFSFASLKGNKQGLECAVCLSRYDDRELLRLLPKCKHAFHIDCVDTWLASHSTCPLCRNRVTPDDLLAVDEMLLLMLSSRRRSMEAIPDQCHVPCSDQQQQAQIGGSVQLSRSSLDIDMGSGPAFQIYVQRPDALEHPANFSSDHDPEACDRHQQQKQQPPPRHPSAEDWMRTRLGHRIIVSDVVLQRRWSDLVPSDVLFLSNAHTLFWPSSGGGSSVRLESNHSVKPVASLLKRALSLGRGDHHRSLNNVGPSLAVSQRCMSELSGLDRFSSCKPGRELLPLTHQQQQGTEDEASTRWSRIARRTLNWLARRLQDTNEKPAQAVAGLENSSA